MEESRSTLEVAEKKELQQRLLLLGHDPKGVDGSIGSNTRVAIKSWQRQASFTESGFLNDGQWRALKDQSDSLYEEWKENQPTRTRQRVKVCTPALGGLLRNCRYEWRYR